VSFGRPHLANIWRRARQFGAAPAAVAALLFGAVRCADLTAPAAVGNISIVYADPAYPSTQITQPVTGKRVDYAVGLELSPKFDVMIGSSIQPRARYVYSRASADSGRVAISQNGNAVRVIRPGIDTVIATVVGATIGGPTNGVKLADTILVFASADSLFVEKRNVTFTAITAVDTLDAAALATDNTAIPGVPIQWTSQNPAVVSVTQLGGGESAILQAQSNGTAVVRVQFAGFAAINVNVTVQQTFKRYFLSPPASAFTSKTATASVTVVAQDSLNQTFVAGTPPAFQYVSSAPGKVSIDPATGLMRAVDNTAGTDVEITAQISGVVTSNTVTASVAQDAMSIDIQSQDPRTISSIGATLSLGVIVRDALNQDWTKEEVLWTVSNSGKATATQFGLTTVVTAQDTGQVYVRAKADNAIDSILVIITNDPATVELSPDPFALTSLNQTGTLAAIVKNAAGTTLTSGFTLTWVSRDSNIVQPQPSGGQMLARNTGEARIVVTTNNNVSDSLTVRVTNAPDTVRIVPDTIFLTNVGDVNSTFAVDFKNGLGATLPKSSVAWTTANVNVADVAVGTGAISAVGSGTTYVLAVSPENPLRRDSVYVVVTNNSASMNVTPGTTQTLTALGATLDFDATVFNSAGNPISGATVTWSVPVGGAFVSVNAVTGVATALANGSATVRATSGGVTRDVTVNVAQAFSATRSTITPAAASIIANGTSSTTISIQLKDANDNNLTFGGATVVPSTSLGTLGGVTDAGNGLYTTTLTSSVTAGTANIGATVNTVAISGNGLVAFTAGAPAKYVVTSTSLTPIAGTSVTIRAQLADANNNPVATSGNAVTFASTGGGTFTGANPASTDLTGVAQITFNTSATVGSHTVSATTGGFTGSSPTINSVAAAGANYLVTPATTSPAAGSAVVITAQLRDANGNPVAQPDQTVNWSLTNANGTFSGSATASTTTDNAGVAQVVLTVSNAAGASTQVRANFGSAPAGTSAAIATVPGSASAATTQITSDVAGVAAGGTATITVQARDGNSPPNDLTSSGGTVVLSTTAGSSLSAVIDNGNGTYTATLSTTTVGAKTITGTINGQAIVDNAVVTVSVAGVSAAQSSATVPAGTAGAATNIVIQSRDQFGNPMGVGGSTVEVTVSGANTVATFTATNVGDGTYTAAYTPAVAGTDNVAIILDGTPISGSPYSSVVSAGALNNFFIDEGAIASQVAGTAFNISIRARDASGNTVTTFSGGANTVDISSTGTLSAGSGTTPAFTNGLLTRSVTISNTGNFTITATRTVGGAPATSSNTFNVAAGAASVANSTVGSTEITRSAGQTAPITVTLIDGNNNPLTNSGGTVALSTNIGTLSAVTNNNNGTYSATFTATTVGTATISGTLNGAGLTDTHVITVTVGAADPANTIITASPGSIAADGAATSTISVAVRDAFGNPRGAGETVNLATTLGALTANPATHVGGGVYTATLTAGLASGIATVTGTLNAAAITDNATVTLTPLAGDNYSVTPASSSVAAGGIVLITAQLRDVNNNPVPQSGKTVNWSKTCNGGACGAPPVGGSFASATSITDANGQAVVALTVSSTGGTVHTVTATDNTALTGTSGNINVQIPVPTLTAVAPTSGDRLQTLDVVFTGTGFIAGISSVDVGAGITINTTTVDSPTQITANLTITAAAATGARSFTVTNTPAGGTSGAQTFTVNNPAPTLTSIAPTSGDRLETLDVVFTGTGFITGISTVNVGADITVNNTTVDSPTQITANITIDAAAATGARNFSVTNSGPGGGTSGNQSFTVENPSPTLTAIAPTSGDRFETLDVVFTGTGFITGVSTVNVGANITVNNTTVDSPTQITANITIDVAAATGARNFSVTNAGPGGGTSGNQTFTVENPTPTLATVNPSDGVQGQTNLDVVLTGTGFFAGATVAFNPAADITVNNTTVDSPTQITINISIGAAAVTGARDVTVTNAGPGGGTSGTQIFTVNAPAAPTLTSIAPTTGNRLQTLDVVFTGTNFYSGVSTVNVGPDITVNNTTVDSPTQITANITIDAAAATGARNFSVTNTPAGGTSADQTFTVENPTATLTSIAPTLGNRTETFDVVFTGTGFIDGVSTVNVGADITINTTTVDGPTQITANITIGAAAATGNRDFSVTNSGPGGGTSANQTFAVNNPAPTISNVVTNPVSGVGPHTFTITGTGFISGVSSVTWDEAVTTTGVATVDNSTQITLVGTVFNATGITRTLRVTNAVPGGGSATFVITVNP
jgi:adhesin/invasin